ncbi:MAG TPA: PIG-L family deacetylase, partial [Arthrobacter sp.]
MVSFTHQDAGTGEDAWAASGLAALPELPLDAGELTGQAFIVLAAHPDDESLGAGGLMARLRRLGARVTVLLCTAGEASHPD